MLQDRRIEWVLSTIGTGLVGIPQAYVELEFPSVRWTGFWNAQPDNVDGIWLYQGQKERRKLFRFASKL
jgi:hypothetical protein